MSEAAYRALYRLGCRLRRTPVLERLEDLEKSQWRTAAAQREHQIEMLGRLLAHARDRSPFYRGLFERHGIDPAATVSLDDLRAIPPVGKRDLAAASADVQNEGLGRGLVRSGTSGSTGEPLVFYRDRDWDAGHRAAVLRGCRWYGVEPWMRSGLLWGMAGDRRRRRRTRLEDAMQNRFRARRFDLSGPTLDAFIRRLAGARMLEGYSSMVYEAARRVNESRSGGARLRLLLVKGTSERIYPHYRSECLRAFGRTMTSEYGAAEAGIIAFECPEGTMHVNTDHVIVEEVGGEIVVTNLLSYSFPFIRYRLGDHVVLRDHVRCACGREGPAVEEIAGRVGGVILGAGGRRFPALTHYYVIKELARSGDLLVRCQARQREKGRLEYLVVLRQGAGDARRAEFEESLREAARRQYGRDIEAVVEFVDGIRDEGAKQSDFVSFIPDS
ncbi:MAG: hypothetical protein PHQ19_00845 [Candidatus Krumholzibacteria bacterium]|nr:hypothetical protein [Candidatus Krumholzibacteria bacterium]